MSAAVRVARTVGMQALLLLALPPTAALTVVALLRSLVTAGPGRRPATALTVLLSGAKMTKALHLARAFHAAGHRVVLVESGRYRFTGHRFSRAVDRFHVVPAPTDPDYVAALVRIVRAEGVDLYVPVCSPASSRHDALAVSALAPHCAVLHGDPATIDRLDDKAAFAEAAEDLGLPVPDTHRVESPEQVAAVEFAAPGRYVLKSIPYDPVHRLDLTPLPRASAEATVAFARDRPISVDRPWIVQQFVDGREYCAHATVRDGRLLVYCCCPSSAFQLNYAAVDHPGIERWVRTFVAGLGLTGQYSFDFLETADGRLYAIECNPRTHSAITLFADRVALADAYLADGPVLRPTAADRPTYWLYQELWRLLRDPRSAPRRWRVLRDGRDAIFAWDDPLPFLLHHHLHIPWLLAGNLVRGRDWVRIDVNIGKLVEPAGD